MLQRLFFEINAPKTCLHHFSMVNTSFDKANNAVFNLLFYRLISHISPSIYDDYFFKVQITVSTPIFTTPSCSFCWGPELAEFWIFFEDFIKRSGKLKSQKNRHFRPSIIIFPSRFLIFCCIFTYMQYGI